MTPEGDVGQVADLVVGLDVLLDSLTAGANVSESSQTGVLRRERDAMRQQRRLEDGVTNLDPLRSLSCITKRTRQ